MGLQEIDQEKREQEQAITQKLFKCIDKRKSLVFDAGAGSGKTYALVESIQYVIQKYGEQLGSHNQKVMCITYTNVAADNIKNKIGNSNLVIVSTIHERLWQLIKSYQQELLILHKENIENIIADDIMELTDKNAENAKVFKVFRELPDEDKKSFEETVWNHKDEFYQGYTMNSDNFRKHYGGYVERYPGIMNNVSNFRTIVGKLYEIRQLKECLLKIKQGKLKNIEYNAMYNQDRLWNMRISHDTLLEYGRTLILSYPVLQQIVFDQFPFVFIDEYQDSSTKVIEIMAVLEERAAEIKHDFFVGYYGDKVQNIYDEGVGCHLLEKHGGLEQLSKEFNRRSYKEIIDAANKIRLDGLVQNSIYKDCLGGSAEFCDTDSIEKMIEMCRLEWGNAEERKIHCFVLKNEEVAGRIGISNLYNIFKKSASYSGARYQQLNAELLSTDIEKLGAAASFLYRILKFYTDVRWEGTPVGKILYGDVTEYCGLDFNELKKIKQDLQEIKGDTLGIYLLKMCEAYEKGSSNVQRIIKAVLDLENVTYNYIVGFFMQTLERTSVQDADTVNGGMDENENFNKVKQLLSISMEELEKWFDYIERKEKEEVIYHTFHGTKGLEFENVLIVLEDGFGKKREDKVFIKSFFEEFSLLETGQQIMEHEKARNLLYVAVTRAKKHLKLIYTGDSLKVREALHYIFDSADCG